MALYKETKRKSTADEVFQPTEHRSYDTSVVDGWQKDSHESKATLSRYQSMIQRGDFLTSEDLAAYKKALDTYTSSAKRLRNLNKTLGGNVENTRDWVEQIRSLNSNYDSISQYYSQWKTADDYKASQDAQKKRTVQLGMDLDAGTKEIEDMEAFYDDVFTIEAWYNAEGRTPTNPQDETYKVNLEKYNKLKSQYGSVADLEKAIQDKKLYLNEAKRLQEWNRLGSVANPEAENYDPEFKQYSGYSSTAVDGIWDKLWSQYGMGYSDLTYEYINNQTGMRTEILRKGASYEGEQFDYDEFMIYDKMNENEISIYNYYYAKDGKEAAEKYLSSIRETLNSREASERFGKLQDNTFAELLFGIEAGVDQFQTGLDNLGNAITGKDDYIPQTSTQMVSGMVREDLADDGPKLPEWMGGASLGQIGYDAVTTTTNMLPSILTSTVVGAINPVLGGVAGSALLGVSASGNAYQEMLNLGYDKGQARTYAALVGGSEAGLQYLLGGIGKLGGKLSGNVVSKVLSGVDNALARTAIKLGGNMLSEGFEEGLQEILTPWLKNLATGVYSEKVNWSEAAYSSLLGALTAGVMESGRTISGEVNTHKTGKALQAKDISAQRLADIGTTFAADTVAYQLAGRVNENTGAYTLGRLFNEIGAELTEANKADIVRELESRGVSAKDAQVMVDAMAAVVVGEEFTDKQIAMLEANDILTKAYIDVIVNPNSTVNQRSQGYKEVLSDFAKQKSANEATANVAQTEPVGQNEGNVTAENTVHTEKEMPTQGDYEAAVEGKTIRKSTGEAVSIKEVASVGNGKMTLRLEDGSEVDSKEIAYSNAGEAYVFETVANLGVDAVEATRIINAFRNSGVEGKAFADGMKLAFEYGYGNFSQQELAQKDFAGNIPQMYINTAYEIGQKMRQQEGNNPTTKKIRDTADRINGLERPKPNEGYALTSGISKTSIRNPGETVNKKVSGKTGGVYYATKDGKVLSMSQAEKNGKLALKDKQSVAVKTAKFLQKLGLGGNYYFFESYVDEKGNRVFKDRFGNVKSAPNGLYYSDGDIYIDINAGTDSHSITLRTLSHELTHMIQQWSAAKYKVIADFLAEQYDKEGRNAYEAAKAKQAELSALRGKFVPFQEAYHEFVADSMSTLFDDGNMYDILTDLKKKDKTIVDYIKKFFDGLAAKARKIYANTQAETDEGQFVQGLSKDTIYRLQQMFAEALVEASEHYATSEQKNTDTQIGVQYSVGSFSDQVDAVNSGTFDRSNHVYMAKTPDIYGKIGLNSGLPMLTTAHHVRKAQMPKNVAKHQHGLTDTQVKDLPNKVADPVMIMDALDANRNSIVVVTDMVDPDGLPIIVSIMADGKGQYNNVEIYSNFMTGYYGREKFDNFMQANINANTLLYINGKKATALAAGPNTQWFGQLKNYSFDTIIRKTRAIVNTNNEKTYDAAVATGDFETAQKLVDQAAKDAGYTRKMFHETNAENIHVFDVSRNEHGGNDSETPYGIFTKTSDKNIGLGDKQMGLYVKADNTLYVKDRADVRNKIPGLLPYYEQIAEIDQKYDALAQQYEDEEFEALGEWVQEHPDADMDEVYPTSYIIDHKPANIDSPKYQEAFRKYEENRKAWEADYNAVAVKCKELITEYLRKNNYDSMYLEVDGGSGGRQTDSLIVLDNHQVKSADPVTYDDRGNIIPLSQRFNVRSNDIRYQDRTATPSNRELLAQALEGVATDVEDYHAIKEYRRIVPLLDAEEAKLSRLNAQIREMSFGKGKRDNDKLFALRLDAKQTQNRIDIYDKQLLKLEATAPLQRVLEREKAKAYKRAEQKGKEAVQMEKERAQAKYDELAAKNTASRKKAVEGRHKTEMRHKIQKVVKKLNDLLLNETKDHHIPSGLKKPVAEALDAIDVALSNPADQIAAIDEQIAKATTPEQAAELGAKKAKLEERAERFADKVNALKAAYDAIKQSPDMSAANSYDEVISSKIQEVSELIGETPLYDMSLSQLEAVYDMYRMIAKAVSNGNKAFKMARAESISQLGIAVGSEVTAAGGSHTHSVKALDGIKKFDWNNLKPIYAFERIGSQTFTELFNNVRAGEDTWAVDVTEARDFYLEQAKKYGYDQWDMKKQYAFKSTTGQDFQLTLEQIMSLYAYSKRDQADDHLRKGGFVFDSAIEVVEKKHGIPVKYTVNTATAYNLSQEILADIVGTLTKEQTEFVDVMQDYLSTAMGAKGNEVSMTLYDVKLFKEKHYFPLKSAKQYMFEQNEVAGEIRLKNSGFSKKTQPHASNPVILSNFMDVWAKHVNDMSMYHAFVLPLEDFNRVYNYKSSTGENTDTESVKGRIQNAYGAQANEYISQLIKDLNGGARSDPRESFSKKLMSRFKKAAVMGSLSVVVQQPTAMIRAMALVDAKHFGIAPITRGMVRTINAKRHKVLWDEVKRYAPVAVIKEMGHFDTDTGRSTVDYIKGDKTFMDKVDDFLAIAPSKADEMAWISIWEAIKRETLSTHKDLRPGSEEFLQAVGERFTEVVTKTQVYDSVLSRSGNMRSKTAFMNMWTAFMAEPTTSINMLQDALRKGKTDKRYAAQTIGAVYGSVILNAALVSVVYAMRDDDEDETFTEKYLSRLTTEILDGINPVTYIPFLKDIWSIMQGFDVERADMSLISDLTDTLQKAVKVLATDTSDMDSEKLAEHQKKVSDVLWSLADNIASLTGIPLKNVRRDFDGVKNLFRTLLQDVNGRKTPAGSLLDKLFDAIKDATPIWGWLPGESRGDKLYDAIMSGDTAYVDRLKGAYKSESAYTSAIRKALRENDPRIKEAAQAVVDGDAARRVQIVKEIIAEGHFETKDIQAAINAEIDKLREQAKEK